MTPLRTKRTTKSKSGLTAKDQILFATINLTKSMTVQEFLDFKFNREQEFIPLKIVHFQNDPEDALLDGDGYGNLTDEDHLLLAELRKEAKWTAIDYIVRKRAYPEAFERLRTKINTFRETTETLLPNNQRVQAPRRNKDPF